MAFIQTNELELHFTGQNAKFLTLSRLRGAQPVRRLIYPNFQLNDGDRLIVRGPNGSGKTNLLRVINQVYKPTRGSITVQGKIRAFLTITAGFFEQLTGRENIYIKSTLLGEDHHSISKKFDEIVEFSGLQKVIDQPIRTYSSGMKVRLAFSIVTSFDTDILLMDEWLSAGDQDFKNKAMNRLKDVINRVAIVVFATHSTKSSRIIATQEITLEGNLA